VYEVLNRFLISLAVLLVIGFSGFIVYNVAYARGDTAGYDRGYSSGQTVGYSSGEQEGYDEGYVSGVQDGYAEGYATGMVDGYNEGVSAGAEYGYTLIDPTYSQVVAFINADRTNDNEYIEDSYVCSHFARDVCNNAEEEGFRCAYVDIRYPDSAHAIIAFDTVDGGLTYFDAITDERVRPVIGERYHRCIEPRPGYYYEAPPFDDTIVDILVIW
jgi:hypothetical protein